MLANEKLLAHKSVASITGPDPVRVQAILGDFEITAAKQERLKAAVVSLGGQTIYSKAFRGPAIDQAVNIKSISKSVVCLLYTSPSPRDRG